MRILLDEGVPDIIQKRLTHRTNATVQELGWRGLRNGDLLDLMAGRFEIIITTDKNLPFQQNLPKRKLAAIVLPSNRMRIVRPLLADIDSTIATINLGESVALKEKSREPR